MSSWMNSSDNGGDGGGPMALVMTLVFKYLNVPQLLIASKVCVAWNEITNDNYLWKTFSLKNCKVHDWEKCIDTICRRNSVVLDTRGMLKPVQPEKNERFWAEFASALKNAKPLKRIELSICPVSLVEGAIYSLPQLTVLNATPYRNLDLPPNPRNLTLSVRGLDQMVQLTELKLNSLNGVKLIDLPSFEKLVNLKTLALTNFRGFSNRGFHSSLESVTTNLEFLEIGDCDYLHVEFAMILKRFTNLTSLRLEKCIDRWNDIAKEVFCSIAGLEKLRILELIYIHFTGNVQDGLKKLNNIKELLVFPACTIHCPFTNDGLVDCMVNGSKNLTHFVWVRTKERQYLSAISMAISKNRKKISQKRKSANNIPVPSTKVIPRLETEGNFSVGINPIPYVKDMFQAMTENTKFKIYHVNLSEIDRVCLIEHFNDV